MTDLSAGKILVTGGAGLIGSAVVWELNRRGYTNIIISDHLRDSDKWKNLVPLRFLDYVEGDQLAEGVYRNPGQYGFSSIFHLGACSATTETNAAYLIQNNYEYTKLLAHFAMAAGLRFVYASSAATYGALETGLSESRPLHSLRPLNMYGYSKHLFDCYAAQEGFLDRITGLKYFNIFGPNENHKGNMRSVVHKAFHEIRDTGRVSLFKSYREEFPHGGQKRDFLYVKDAAVACMEVAEHLAADRELAGQAFNFSIEVRLTVLQIVRQVLSLMGREDLEPVIQNTACSEIREQYISAQKARNILDWTPKYTMEKGLTETIDWYTDFFACGVTAAAAARMGVE